MPKSRINDVLEHLPIRVANRQVVKDLLPHPEAHVEDQCARISHVISFIDVFDEWRVTKELNAVAVEGEPRHQFSGVRDQCSAILNSEPIPFEPIFQHLRLRENSNSLALLEPVTRLGAPHGEL